MSNNQGVWCSKCYGDHYTNDCPVPVAPVEAKEKHVQRPIPCPTCKAPVFVRENGNIISHYDGDGDRCSANETKMPCDCWKHEQTVCDICQGVAEPKPTLSEKDAEGICKFCGRYITRDKVAQSGWVHKLPCPAWIKCYGDAKPTPSAPVGILPCPFCGEKPRGSNKDKVTHCQMHGDPSQAMIVCCVNPACHARPSVSAGDVHNGGESKARSEAIAAWNTRSLKTQPDSSSIPDLKPWLDQAVDLLNLYHSGYCPKDVAKDFLEKCKLNFGNVADYKPFVDSSSISTEQAFDEWWMEYRNSSDFFNKSLRNNAIDAWNAAKGQSNGR